MISIYIYIVYLYLCVSVWVCVCRWRFKMAVAITGSVVLRMNSLPNLNWLLNSNNGNWKHLYRLRIKSSISDRSHKYIYSNSLYECVFCAAAAAAHVKNPNSFAFNCGDRLKVGGIKRKIHNTKLLSIYLNTFEEFSIKIWWD